MAQLSQPVEPFGEVNVYPQPDGSLDIVATVLMVPDIEGARTGLALDASASMKSMYGVSSVLGGAFAKAAATPNVVEPVARMMAAYLSQFSSTGTCDIIYWAVSPAGDAVEPLKAVNAADAETVAIVGPKKFPWGRGTKLLPAVKHFVDVEFRAAPWAICVFVTDGVLEDLAAVKAYCLTFAKEIASGRRKFIKLVLIGVGEQVDVAQMEELDDMFEGSGLKMPNGDDIDLWDHKLAREMRQLHEVFAEVVSEKIIIADRGRILDSAGRVAVEFPDGVPALLRFSLPRGSTSFTLELPDHRVIQDLRAGLARV